MTRTRFRTPTALTCTAVALAGCAVALTAASRSAPTSVPAISAEPASPPQTARLTVDLPDEVKDALRSSSAGLRYTDLARDWIARVEGRADRVLSLSVWVRNGSPGRTGRAEAAGDYGGGMGWTVLLFRHPPVEAPTSDALLPARAVRPGSVLSVAEHFGRGRPPAGERDVLDWTASSVRAATPSGLDLSRVSALFVAAVPLGLREDSQVQPLILLVPNR
jgi:hypothetical protein